MMNARTAAAVCALLALCTYSASGSYPTAQNIVWQSTNFKTVLSWDPKPTEDYSYTVEYGVIGGDRQRNPHCLRSSDAVCDLTISMTKLKANYTADILSEPPRGVTSTVAEAPHATSPRFCPYTDTHIGRPDFKIITTDDRSKITLVVIDPLTAQFEGNRQLNIRDIFADDLQYMVTYRKSTSTGKKDHKSKTSNMTLTGLDKGESYCFNVQAYIPSRRTDKQLGDISSTKCSESGEQSFSQKYSLSVIAAATFLILLLIGIVIAVTVVCYKRRKNAGMGGLMKLQQDV